MIVPARSAPFISIAMPVYNSSTTVAYAIESIRWQTYQNWELLVLDDGSSDDTGEIVASIADPRIRYVGDKQNIGLAARLNQAVAAAKGEYLARMDADDIAYPQRLEKQVDVLERHQELDLIGTGAMVFSNSGDAVGIYPSRVTHEQICNRPWAGFHIAHPTWMGRTAWFRRHPYNPAAKKAQDQVLLLSAYDTSRFACLPEILLGYRQETVALAKVSAGRYHFCRGLMLHGLRRHAYVFMLRGMAEQAAKFLIELIVIPTGLARRILRHRALAASAPALDEWRRIRSELCERVSALGSGCH